VPERDLVKWLFFFNTNIHVNILTNKFEILLYVYLFTKFEL
jgi:hypothetical protein